MGSQWRRAWNISNLVRHPLAPKLLGTFDSTYGVPMVCKSSGVGGSLSDFLGGRSLGWEKKIDDQKSMSDVEGDPDSHVSGDPTRDAFNSDLSCRQSFPHPRVSSWKSPHWERGPNRLTSLKSPSLFMAKY